MQATKHIGERMSQRGVTRNMVDIVLGHGATIQDKHVLGRRDALKLLERMRHEARIVQKVVDKGGVIVVAEADMLITTFNCNESSRHQGRHS